MNDTVNTIMNTPFAVLQSEAMQVLNNLHFIRADWFYAFIPLILFLLLMRKRTQSDKNWHAVIDQKLLPFVLTKTGSRRRTYPLLIIFLAAGLCITALAGPVYKKLPQPVYREQSSLVILLDLSQSMNATDIKPSRLYRAKLELLDILNTRKTGQTALVVYAAEAFVVTPLTDDNTTITNLIPALETDMMPAQGSNLSAALAKTISLFNQSGIIRGDILVITDDIHQDDKEAIDKIHSQGFRLSIFGIGTSEGGPIPLQGSVDGGFLQDSNGAIVIPKLEPVKLQTYALTGGGLYTGLQADDSDTKKLNRLFQSAEIRHDAGNKDTNADVWQEEGHWLLLPLLFFAALWARKGWIAAILPFAISFMIALPMMAVPWPVYAEPETTASDKAMTGYLDIKHLWSTPDQKAMKAFNAGDTEKAARQFTRPDWKASAYYRSGDYASAAMALENPVDSNAYYNKANALAKLGKYEEAIKTYDRAIELNENNEDAKYNREQVKKALQEQQQNSQQKDSEQQNSDQQNSDQSDKQENSQQQQNQQNSENQQQQQENQSAEHSEENKEADEKQQTDTSTAEQQKSEDQQQAEEKQLRQRDAKAEAEKEQQEKQQYEQQQNKSTANKEVENKESDEKPAEIEINPMEASITEEEKATEQWLKRIPDDPGGLLRRKFLYQYKQMPDQTDEKKPW